MRDRDVLRARIFLALTLGASACGEDEPTGSEASKGAAAGAEEPDRGTKESGSEPTTPEGGSPHGSLAQRIKPIVEKVETEVPPKVEVDPVLHCGAPQLTLTVEDADARRYDEGDALGCALYTAPVDVTGPASFTLEESNTQALRDAGNTTHCCYRIIRPVRGRPLRAGSTSLLPGFEIGPRWAAGLPDPTLARRIAAAWLHDARLEWASVVSFERAAQELRRLGAPSALQADYARAADDERRHATQCLRLARCASGRSIGLTPLAPLGPRPGGLRSCLRRTFIEGCVAETAAALVAARSARRAHEDIAAVLRRIADDETDHAALAWATIGWGLQRCSADERRAFVAWARRQRPVAVPPGRDPDARWGRLSPASEAAIAAEAWVHCIEPLLSSLHAATMHPHQFDLALSCHSVGGGGPLRR